MTIMGAITIGLSTIGVFIFAPLLARAITPLTVCLLFVTDKLISGLELLYRGWWSKPLRATMDNKTDKRYSRIYIPEGIQYYGDFLPPQINKSGVKHPNVVSPFYKGVKRPLDNNALDVVNSPIPKFDNSQSDNASHTAKSSIGETDESTTRERYQQKRA